jgi:DNA-binding NarL/FixJ family response regulator
VASAVVVASPRLLPMIERALRRLGVAAVAETPGAEQTAALVARRQPDVFLFHLDSSDTRADALRSIRRASPTAVPVVAVCSSTESAWIEAVLGAGASAYLVEQENHAQLTNALGVVFQRVLHPSRQLQPLDAGESDRGSPDRDC